MRLCRGGQINAAYLLPGIQEPLQIYSKEQAEMRKYDLLPGFVKARAVEQIQQFQPPKVPPDFRPFHTFPADPSISGEQLCLQLDRVLTTFKGV
jgi:hypothetical protein